MAGICRDKGRAEIIPGGVEGPCQEHAGLGLPPDFW